VSSLFVKHSIPTRRHISSVFRQFPFLLVQLTVMQPRCASRGLFIIGAPGRAVLARLIMRKPYLQPRVVTSRSISQGRLCVPTTGAHRLTWFQPGLPTRCSSRLSPREVSVLHQPDGSHVLADVARVASHVLHAFQATLRAMGSQHVRRSSALSGHRALILPRSRSDFPTRSQRRRSAPWASRRPQHARAHNPDRFVAGFPHPSFGSLHERDQRTTPRSCGEKTPPDHPPPEIGRLSPVERHVPLRQDGTRGTSRFFWKSGDRVWMHGQGFPPCTGPWSASPLPSRSYAGHSPTLSLWAVANMIYRS
jgi:hypothetical protein